MADDLRFRVLAKCPRTPVVVEVQLAPVDEPLDYLPGHYVLLSDIDYQRPPRSYSIANAPRPDGRLDLLVTLVPGGEVSPWVHDELEAGSDVLVSGPYGSFLDDLNEPGPRLYLAGGSGLAPIRALMEAALQRHDPPPMTLVFSARTAEDLIDDDRFRGWEQGHSSFRYLRTLTRAPGPPPVGHIPDLLVEMLPPLDGYRVYVAGGSGFVAACEDAARRKGAQHVLTEEFFADPRPWGSDGGTTAPDGDE